LIRQCWSGDPNERPTIKDAISALTPCLTEMEYGMKKLDNTERSNSESVLKIDPSSLINADFDYNILELRGKLHITRVEAVDVPDYPNLFVKIRYGGTTYRTKPLKKNEKKMWVVDLTLDCWFTSKIIVELCYKKFLKEEFAGQGFFMPLVSVDMPLLPKVYNKGSFPGMLKVDHQFTKHTGEIIDPVHHAGSVPETNST